MRYLGLDLGTKTLGLALSDGTGLIASPYKILYFGDNHDEALWKELALVIEEEKVDQLVLGLPKNMNNSIGERGKTTIEFQKELEKRFLLPVHLQDERLSTVEATHYLLEADMSRKKRKQKIDALAATIILQTYLDRKG